MTNHPHRRILETQRLSDLLFDDRIQEDELQQLDALLTTDPQCLQTYIERIDLHGELLFCSSEQSEEQQLLETLHESSRAALKSRSQRRLFGLVAVMTAVVLIVSSLSWILTRPVPVGRITHITQENPDEPPERVLGDVVRTGQILSCRSGILSLTVNRTILDLIGPAELVLDNAETARLLSGSVHVQVLPGGEGFSVLTPHLKVVDLGTEFLVQYDPETGTEVSVRQGRAQLSLLDEKGVANQVLELTSRRAAKLTPESDRLEQIQFQTEPFQSIDRSRAAILSIDGLLRTPRVHPRNLQSEQTTTTNHLLVIPERQGVLLEADLTLEALHGPLTIPAGTTVCSYLVHYDPTALATQAPRGAVTFDGEILACLVTTEALLATDELFGLENTVYESRAFRGLEPEADEVTLSEGGQTVSFYFGISPPGYLDEVRVLLISE